MFDRKVLVKTRSADVPGEDYVRGERALKTREKEIEENNGFKQVCKERLKGEEVS